MPPDRFIREAGAPYADTDADVILRSSDGADFRVHRLFLSKASPVFGDMFTLGSSDALSDDKRKDDLRVVEMSEDETSLRLLLGYCYLALGIPTLQDLDEAECALRVVDKFQLGFARSLVEEGFRRLAEQDPERVYAIGWKMRNRNLAQVGALESLAKPYTAEVPELSKEDAEELGATAVLNLLAYQRDSIKAAHSALSLSWWSKNGTVLPIRRAGSTVTQDTCVGGTQCRWRTRWIHITSDDILVTINLHPPLVGYLDAARDALAISARGRTVEDAYLASIAVDVASGGKDVRGIGTYTCFDCVRSYSRWMPVFTKELAAQIEENIAEVALKTPF